MTWTRVVVLLLLASLAGCRHRSGDARSEPGPEPAPEPSPSRRLEYRPVARTELPSRARAVAEFDERRRKLVQAWLSGFAKDAQNLGSWSAALGAFKDNGGMTSFRRIAAALTALKRPDLFKDLPPADFPDVVTQWTAGIYKYAIAGSPTNASEGDYDFVMKEMVSLIYTFQDDPHLLSDDAIYNIVHRGLVYRGRWQPDEGHKMTVSIVGLTFPETENHVLMTLSSWYLTNQWILENPRNDPRLAQGEYADRSRFEVEGTALERQLLQFAARPLHGGFFETNARPYQQFTWHALLNLQQHAASPTVRTAFLNAMTYLSAKFAFQSFRGLRMAPHRRNHKYSDSLDCFGKDGMNVVFGVLSGALPVDSFGPFNPEGHALWTALSRYSLPSAIHDWMLDKHAGYWARMQTRFTQAHYKKGRRAKYFEGSQYFGDMRQIEPAAEAYFATNDFMNVSGGCYERYKFNHDAYPWSPQKHDVHVFDWMSTLQVLMTSDVDSTVGWANPFAVSQVFAVMQGHDDQWFRSCNNATYKGFSYGYYWNHDEDIHLQWPQFLPPSWNDYLHVEDGQRGWGVGRAGFRVYDFTDNETPRLGVPANIYVVVGQISKSHSAGKHRNFARGFWEAVPKARFESASALVRYVVDNNPPHHFSANIYTPPVFYKYKMTTGEVLELEPSLGADNYRCGRFPYNLWRCRCRNPIRRAWIDGQEVPLSRIATDRCSVEGKAQQPLLIVEAVDAVSHKTTNVVLALAQGDGTLTLTNPYVGASIELDSSDFRRPKHVVSAPRRMKGPRRGALSTDSPPSAGEVR